MKTRIFVMAFFMVLSMLACKPGTKKDQGQTEARAEIRFNSNLHDFGTIPYGSDGRCYFEFINSSDNDLIINNVRTTCGCTRPEWPEKPVAPGETGKIGVSYNTRLEGKFNKAITVYSNAENSPVTLVIRGSVEPEKKPSQNKL